MGVLSGRKTLGAEELAEVKTSKVGRKPGYAQEAIDEFLTLPKAEQRAGIEIPASNFNTPDKTRDVPSVVSAINTRAIAANAPVMAKRSVKRPETHVVMFYGQHTKTGPRDKTGS